MSSIRISRSTVIRCLLLSFFTVTLIAQQPPAEKPKQVSPWDKPNPDSPWDTADPDSPWDTIDPLSPWDNPNAGASWDSTNPFTDPISGRWRSSYTDQTGARKIVEWQLEENGTAIRLYPVSIPVNKENTYLGVRRGHYIVITYPNSGAYQCPEGTRSIFVRGIDEFGVSDDGKKLTHKVRAWDLVGEAPDCKVRLKDSWEEFQVFEGVVGVLERLRYVELKDGKYVPIEGELKHGSTFFVEAAFDSKPAEAEYAVQLSWGEGTGAEVKVRRSSDPTIFRSAPIRLQPPAVNQ